MTIYYIKQDNTVWCCEEDSGPYQEEIEDSFVKCECESVWAGKESDIADHLQGHAGGGKVLKWRVAKGRELAAWYSGGDDAFQEGIAYERERIAKILELEPHDTKSVVTSGDFQKVHDEKYCTLCVRLRMINGESK